MYPLYALTYLSEKNLKSKHAPAQQAIETLKFVYSKKATKFCEISTLLLSTVHTDKIKVEISQNFVAFSEYLNFIRAISYSKTFQNEKLKSNGILFSFLQAK